MFSTFEYINKNFRIRPRDVVIDNTAFWLHYRVTTLLLFAGMAIITTKQFIGEHIACVTETMVKPSVPVNVINTFCFFMATFTVPIKDNNSLPYAGVGPWPDESTGEHKRHTYYQWVPFVLFGQALAFYLPHYCWKRLEGGRIKSITEKLKHASYSLTDCEGLTAPNGTTIPTKKKTSELAKNFTYLLLERLKADRSWTICLLICESLNVINVFVQWKLTDLFLNNQFSDLGYKALYDDSDPYILDEVFPKMGKCTFHKYGPSGTIQKHDAMCVLPLNIVNEKTYVIVWWWYWILGGISVATLIWRLLQLFLHSRSNWFNQWVWQSNNGIRSWSDGMSVTGEFHYCDWLLLYYLAANLDPIIFRYIFRNLASVLSGLPEPLLANAEKINIDENSFDDFISDRKVK